MLEIFFKISQLIVTYRSLERKTWRPSWPLLIRLQINDQNLVTIHFLKKKKKIIAQKVVLRSSFSVLARSLSTWRSQHTMMSVLSSVDPQAHLQRCVGTSQYIQEMDWKLYGNLLIYTVYEIYFWTQALPPLQELIKSAWPLSGLVQVVHSFQDQNAWY